MMHCRQPPMAAFVALAHFPTLFGMGFALEWGRKPLRAKLRLVGR